MNKHLFLTSILMFSFILETLGYACGCSAPVDDINWGAEACQVDVTYEGSADCCHGLGPTPSGTTFSVLDCGGEELYNFHDNISGGVAFCTGVGSLSCG